MVSCNGDHFRYYSAGERSQSAVVDPWGHRSNFSLDTLPQVYPGFTVDMKPLLTLPFWKIIVTFLKKSTHNLV